MGTSVIQPSFAGGELSPALYGRADLSRYQTSLKTCRNFISQVYGGAKNRSGTKYIAGVKTHTSRVRLIPFAFSTTQTYVLEFGNLYMRVYKDGGQVVYSSGGSAGQPVEIATPWTEAQLDDINYTQSADVLTVVHPSHAPRQISRTAHDAWTIGTFANTKGPFQDVNIDTAKTMYLGAATGSSVSLTTNFDVFDSSYVGALIYIEKMPNYTVEAWETSRKIVQNDIIKASSRFYKATSADPSAGVARITGTLRPSHTEGKEWDGTGNLEGAVYRAPSTSTNADAYVGVEWEYLHSGFGIAEITAVGGARAATVTIIQRMPEEIVGSGNASHKWAFEAWGNTQGWPAAVTYFQQRLVFANTTAQPQTVWMSKTSNFTDFGKSSPVLDDDAITFTLASRQVNAIRHMLALDKLVLLTSGSEWVMSGGGDEVVTPSNISARIQGYRGSSKRPPIAIGNTALYLQDKGSVVRDLGYEFQSDSYTGNDLTVMASHLVQGYTLTDWTYQQVPNSVVWAVRDDGALMGMTYMREQQVVGWHRHDTDGEVESVCSISEGTEDALYIAVKRTINGSTKRYVERMQTRFISDIRDAFFVDSGLTYDGRNTGSTTMTLTTNEVVFNSWNFTETDFTLTASASYFVVGDIGSEIHMPQDDGRILRLLITACASATVVTVTANRNVALELRDTATATWTHARKEFAGLGHLEGKTVSILADGHVEPQKVVTSGAIELSVAAGVVHVGLPIEADFETLDIAPATQETIRDKQKIIQAVRMILEESRGVFAGKDQNNLLEYKQRASENYDDPVSTLTGIADIQIIANWNKGGRIFVRQSDPLPLSILAVIPELSVGGA